MQTKAELEAELARLRVRVAELEGAVAAYQYALTQVNKPETYPYYTGATWVWPETVPVTPFTITS